LGSGLSLVLGDTMTENNKDKSIHYILETLNILIENESVLLKRIKNLEDKLEDLARAILGEVEKFENGGNDDRTIN
tara:strand:- start:29 stop:256 length:228 start_codon:yes stop_codon:yes gene_type:complete